MDIDTNRIQCCTVGGFYYELDEALNKWKQAHKDCTIVHLMQSQEDKFIVVTIWYREKLKGQISYKDGEYCSYSNCNVLLNKRSRIWCQECEAYKFHNYLTEKGIL